ncbi:MAG: polysaccharide deacetylase family protein [Gemmatimonadaceae bacterium]
MRAILTYHSLDDSGSPISLHPATFAEHVQWLASPRIRVVGLLELLAADPDVDAIAITFDDGFRNFETHAAPLLRDAGLPATLFVVSNRVGDTNAWSESGDRGIPVLPLLGWGRLRRLTAAGVTIGAHGRTHRVLPGLDAATLEDEVVACADRIADELGEKPTSFAYPYGGVDEAVTAAVAKAGYGAACTTELRALARNEDPHLLPRLDAFYLRRPGQLERWGSRAFRGRLWIRARARGIRRHVENRGMQG